MDAIGWPCSWIRWMMPIWAKPRAPPLPSTRSPFCLSVRSSWLSCSALHTCKHPEPGLEPYNAPGMGRLTARAQRLAPS